MARTLIIGYGNELRGDDGAGVRLAQQLADDPALDGRDAVVLARRQLTPDLALDLSLTRRLILLDATTQLAPGETELRRLAIETPAAAAPSSHHITPELLLGLAQELYGRAPETSLLSIGAGSLEMGEGLSAEVGAALDRARQQVVDLLDA
jgi:hydrogenase maturation protease